VLRLAGAGRRGALAVVGSWLGLALAQAAELLSLIGSCSSGARGSRGGGLSCPPHVRWTVAHPAQSADDTVALVYGLFRVATLGPVLPAVGVWAGPRPIIPQMRPPMVPGPRPRASPGPSAPSVVRAGVFGCAWRSSGSAGLFRGKHTK